MAMFSDNQLRILRDAMGEQVEILDTDDSVLATVRGFFKRRTSDIDFGGPNYSEIAYEATTEDVIFDCRTVDVTGSWVGKRLQLKSGYRDGSGFPVIYNITDRRDDGQGISKFVLDR